MTNIKIIGDKAETVSPPAPAIHRIFKMFEGRKSFIKASGNFRFEASQSNISLYLSAFPDAKVIEDQSEVFEAFVNLDRPKFEFKTKPYDHQLRGFNKLKNSTALALFMEQGTGKSKVLTDYIAFNYCAGEIDAAIILSPKGVHHQWVDEQLPTHMSSNVKYEAWAWDNTKKELAKYEKLKQSSGLQIVTMNIDAIKFAGYDLLVDFIQRHKGRICFAIDEAHQIKNASSKRTQKAIDLGGMCSHRAILTGSPIAKNIADLFAEFKFLQEGIIETRYFTTFRNKYCETRHNGFGIVIVGAKNLEELYRKIDPVTFRATKDELDLPPKVYDEYVFELSPKQKKHYTELKELFLTQIDENENLSVVNAASSMVRLQQIASGYLPKEDGSFAELENPRLDALLAVLENIDGKAIIWARFNADIEIIMKALGDKAVSYYGATDAIDRDKNKHSFLHGNAQYLVANPAAAGTGLNLQGSCNHAIYYSNSFNAIDRWQSEDRIHRIGTKGHCIYIDLIARGTVDKHILNNLKGKKSLSDLALDDVRKMLENG